MPTVLETRIAVGTDDVEQRGSTMSRNNSDLELVTDGSVVQQVGLRFINLAIPAGAVITAAYIQFTTDEIKSAATNLTIRGLAADDLAAFISADNNLSSRPTTSAAASWQPAAWTTIDQAGLAQRTADLTALVQEIVGRSGWQSGNDLGFVVTGSGTRTAHAFEGGAAKAPLLHIEYELGGVPGGNTAPTLDLDQSAGGTGFSTSWTVGAGAVPLADTDLDIADATDTNMEQLTVALANPQAGDLLSVNGALPSGIGIGSGTTATSLILTGSAAIASYEAALRQVRFDNGSASPDLTARQVSVTVNDGEASSSPAVATIAMQSGGGGGGGSVTIVEKRIAAGADDVEQRVSNGRMGLGGDIELVADGSTMQQVGLRFTNLAIPAGAVITAAYIQFTADEIKSAAANLTIRGLDSPDLAPFTNTANNLSSRPATDASVGWQPAAWTAVDQAGAAQRTPDLTQLVQEIVDLSGWASGNDLGFVVTGTGTRTARAFENSASKAALLHVEYTLGNTAPTLDLDASAGGIGFSTSWIKGAGAVPLADTDLDIADATDTAMEQLTVTLANPQAGDVLSVDGALPTGISIDSGTTAISLILTGPAAIASYEAALRQVRFDNASATPDLTARQVTVTANDGEANSTAAVATIAINIPGTGLDLVLTPHPGFRENVAGATVGTLSVANPEPGQTYSFSVADSRYQIVGTQLKLSTDTRLDFERTPSVTIDITATRSGGGSFLDSVTAALGNVAETRFAALGDYGNRTGAASVAALVSSLNVDFIVTTGDNLYGAEPIDDQIGRHYSAFIGNYQGTYDHQPGQPNRFWPSLGNHDYTDAAAGTNASAYLDYFTLPSGPGNERYYDVVIGPVHFFAVNSNIQEPDGNSSTSDQALWLQGALASSSSPYKIVYFHHPSYSSGQHGSSTTMQWPFEQWGATAVLTGHDHDYERIMRDDNGDLTQLPYFVTGLGGADWRDFVATPVEGSVSRYTGDFGTMLVQASEDSITFDFISVAGGGTLIDSHTIDLPNTAPALDLNGADGGTGHTGTYTARQAEVPISDLDPLITDLNDTNMEWLTVALANPQSGDQLSVSGALPSNISVHGSSTASTLVLAGTASEAAYQTALTQVRFANSSSVPATADRLINVTVSDGLATSAAAVATIGIDLGGNILRVPEDYSTIQAAVNAAVSGDTILVGPGTYAGGITVAGKSIIISSRYQDDPSLVDLTVINGGAPAIEIAADAPNTIVQGFHFTTANYGVVFNAPGGLALDNFFDDLAGDSVSFESVGGTARGNRFFSPGDDSVDVDFVQNSDVLIENNTMTASGDDGIEIRNNAYTGPLVTITMRNNIIVGSEEDGIQIIDYDGVANRQFVIERNLIRDSADVGLGLMGGGISLEDASGHSMPERIHVFNNTFDGNRYGITGGDNLVAVNNIISNSSVMGVKNIDGSSTVSHTLFHGNALDHSGSNIDLATTSSGDPLYASSHGLQSGSPAIDAGAASFTFNGESVLTIIGYTGSAPDLGWSELTG